MKTPKGYVAIEFGKLLPGDEFVQPENLNRVLLKRRSGDRFSYVEPGGVLGPDKVVYAKKGERQEKISEVMNVLQQVSNQLATVVGIIGTLHGVEEEPEEDGAEE